MKDNIKYFKKLVKNTFNEFKIGTNQMFKEFFKKETNKKQRANMWTFIRLIIPVVTLIMSSFAITSTSTILFVLTGLIAGFGAVTDYFDGRSSRKHNSASEYGKLLDQVSDKFFAGIIGLNLTFLNPYYLLILLGELLIAGVNIGFKIKYKDLDITSTKIGKIKEWPLFLSLALGFLSPINSTFLGISLGSIILTTIFQLATTTSYLIENKKLVNEVTTNKNNVVCENEKLEEKELVLSKTLEKTKLEQYKQLRDMLSQVIENETEETIKNEVQKKINKKHF